MNNPSKITRSLEGTGSLGLLANLPDCLSGETGSTPVWAAYIEGAEVLRCKGKRGKDARFKGAEVKKLSVLVPQNLRTFKKTQEWRNW